VDYALQRFRDQNGSSVQISQVVLERDDSRLAMWLSLIRNNAARLRTGRTGEHSAPLTLNGEARAAVKNSRGGLCNRNGHSAATEIGSESAAPVPGARIASRGPGK